MIYTELKPAERQLAKISTLILLMLMLLIIYLGSSASPLLLRPSSLPLPELSASSEAEIATAGGSLVVSTE